MSTPNQHRGDTIISIDTPTLRPMLHGPGELADVDRVQETQFKIRLANTEGVRSRASFLIKRRYAWRGYTVSDGSSGLSHQITLAAFNHEKAVATITVGIDSPAGLTVESLYPQEILALRTRARRLCEFTRLAVDSMTRSKPVLAAIFHIAYIYAHRIRGCTELLIEVNPRHVRFYEAMLGFTRHGPERVDPRVSAPAVLLCLELAHAESEIARLGGHAELADQVKSLYPLFFSPKEERGIEGRLRTMD